MAAALVGAFGLVGCGGGGTAAPAQVAAAAGASNCDDSGYQLISRTTGSSDEIYDCAFTGSNGIYGRCVTYADGVANDSTAVARIVFASTLGAQKPSCLSG